MIEITEYSDRYKEDVIKLILDIQVGEFSVAVTREDQPDLEIIPQYYQKNGNFWVALEDNKPVGTIALVRLGNNNGALRKMFVKKEYRGKQQGIAANLLKGLLHWAGEQGIQDVYLGTTEKYHAAHRFYEKSGFARIDRQQLPEDFIIMAVDNIFYHRKVRQ